MPSAVAVSHRQQAMRIAINTGCLALIRPQLGRWRTGIPYQCFKEPASRNPGRPSPASAGNWRARNRGGIDLPA
jgi:hypothetical protein